MMTLTKTFFLSFLLILPLGIQSTVSADQLLQNPNIDNSPEDVVRIVISALAKNDLPYKDAGIETTFRFASPSNKVNTGPIAKFSNMVKQEPYGIMVDHQNSEFSEVVMSNGLAYQIVQLTGQTGKTVAFAFRLAKQIEGEFKDMWMTEAVWPLSRPKDPLPSF